MADEKKTSDRIVYDLKSASIGVRKGDGTVSSLLPLQQLTPPRFDLRSEAEAETEDRHPITVSFEPITVTMEWSLKPETYDFVDSLFLTSPEAGERYRVAPSGRVMVSTDYVRDRRPERESELPEHGWCFIPLLDKFCWSMALRTGEQLEDLLHRLNLEMEKLEQERRRLLLTRPIIFPPPYP